MLDAESLIFERLSLVPDVWVSSENEPSVTFPAVVYSVSGEGQTGNGPTIWRLTLTVSVLVEPHDFQKVGDVYDAIHSWVGKRSASGHVTRVEDTSLLSRASSTVVNNKTINQYTGSFSIIARP